MQEKSNAIIAELEALREQVENMEEQITALEAIVNWYRPSGGGIWYNRANRHKPA